MELREQFAHLKRRQPRRHALHHLALERVHAVRRPGQHSELYHTAGLVEFDQVDAIDAAARVGDVGLELERPVMPVGGEPLPMVGERRPKDLRRACKQQQCLVTSHPRCVVRRRSEDALVVQVWAEQRQPGDTPLHGVIDSYMPRSEGGGRSVRAALTAERTELSEAAGGELGALGDESEAGGAGSPSN